MAEETTTEAPRTVVITPDDCKIPFDFWTHFEIAMQPELKEALDKFAKNPTIENQENVKYWLTTAISTTDHEAFKDEMFSKITQQCGNISYEMAFDRDLEKTLTTTEEQKAE